MLLRLPPQVVAFMDDLAGRCVPPRSRTNLVEALLEFVQMEDELVRQNGGFYYGKPVFSQIGIRDDIDKLLKGGILSQRDAQQFKGLSRHDDHGTK